MDYLDLLNDSQRIALNKWVLRGFTVYVFGHPQNGAFIVSHKGGAFGYQDLNLKLLFILKPRVNAARTSK